jgi:hypothetical protein
MRLLLFVYPSHLVIGAPLSLAAVGVCCGCRKSDKLCFEKRTSVTAKQRGQFQKAKT